MDSFTIAKARAERTYDHHNWETDFPHSIGCWLALSVNETVALIGPPFVRTSPSLCSNSLYELHPVIYAFALTNENQKIPGQTTKFHNWK
jgi:hypothetical protein